MYDSTYYLTEFAQIAMLFLFPLFSLNRYFAVIYPIKYVTFAINRTLIVLLFADFLFIWQQNEFISIVMQLLHLCWLHLFTIYLDHLINNIHIITIYFQSQL